MPEPIRVRASREPARTAASLLAGAAVVYALVIRALAPPEGALVGPRIALAVAAAFGVAALVPARWTGRVLALVLAGVSSLAGAELALRALVGDRYVVTMGLDPRAIYKLLPGVSTHYSRSGETFAPFAVTTNSRGFRGPELRTDGGKRVVVYGDSYVEADYTADEATFVAQLGKALGVEAVNAGVVGYGPDQELRRLEDELPKLAPALVVVVVYTGNDFGDLVRDKLYRLDDEGELVPNRYTLSRRMREQFERAGGMLLPRVTAASIAGVRQRWATHDERLDDETVRRCTEETDDYGKDDIVTNLFHDHDDADVALTPASASAHTKVRLMEKVVARMADVAGRARTPFLLVIAPTPLDACEGHPLGWPRDPARSPDYRPSGRTEVVADIARRHGIAHVDLWDAFQANHPCDLYFRTHDHWNDAGQRLASEVVAEAIRSNKLM